MPESFATRLLRWKFNLYPAGYVVWDKAASIRFRKPGRGALFATFKPEDAEVEAVTPCPAEVSP